MSQRKIVRMPAFNLRHALHIPWWVVGEGEKQKEGGVKYGKSNKI